jgi:outer membrane protein TolC
MRLALLLLFAAGPAAAKTVEPVRWSTAAYVRAALEASPAVRQSRDRLEAARLREKSQFARTMLPTLSLSASMNPAELAPQNRFTFDAWRGSANDWSVSPSMSWNLFNNFKDSIANRTSALSSESGKESVEIARQQQALDALQTYYRTLRAERLVAVAEQNRKIQKDSYDLTQDRYKHGMKSLTDLLKTETDWRSAELELENRKAQYRLSLFQFNVLIERDEGTEVLFPADLQLGTTEAPRLDDGLRDAMRARPEMRRNRNELETADLAWRRAKIDAGPTLSLDFSYSDPVTGSFQTTRTEFGLQDATYGFTLKLSLPSSFNVYSQVQTLRAARADWRRSRETRTALSRTVRTEVYRTHNELLRALRSYEIALRKEDISRQNLELVKEQYSQGSANVIRLSEAQRDFVRAQTERLDAFRDANIGRASYRRAIGESIWH